MCPKGAEEKEKKSACLLYFDYSAGASGQGEEIVLGREKIGVRRLKGRDKGRIASKSGCSYQAGSQKTKTVMDTCFIDLRTYNNGRTHRKVMGGGWGWGIFEPQEFFVVINFLV